MNNPRLHRAITPEADKTHAKRLVENEQGMKLEQNSFDNVIYNS